jgi:Mg-chelatase subunit ChlD
VEEGGDGAVFTSLYLRGIGTPPVSDGIALDRAVALPDPCTLVKHFEPALAGGLDGGSREAVSFAASGKGLTPPDDKLILVVLPPNGKNSGLFLEGLMAEVQPDMVLLDERPFNFSASMMYTFSLSCAAGIPAQAEITYAKNGQIYDSRHFLPGSLDETALILCWQGKIPLIPVGPLERPIQPEIYSQHGYLYEAFFWSRWQSGLNTAYRELDACLADGSGQEEQRKKTEGISRRLMESVGDEMDRPLLESLRAESCYIASRILDITAYNRQQGKNPRILALVDITHYADLAQYLSLSGAGQFKDFYSPSGSIDQSGKMLVTGRKRSSPDPEQAGLIPAESLAQRLFNLQFSAYIESKEREKLEEREIHGMIAEIAARLRTHPDVASGVSVRGTIACEEVMRGFADTGQDLTRKALFRAALVTLPPRLSLKLKGDTSLLVADTVKEVVYGFRYSASGYSTAASAHPGQLSTDAILESLEKLGPLPARQKPAADRAGLPAILSEADKKASTLKYLESLDLIKKDGKGRYSLTQKALEHMLNELDKQFNAGEISRQEYDSQKARYSTLLKNLSDPQQANRASEKEQANTIMEMLDAQDRGWNSGINFNLMHLYYHVKQTSEGSELSPQKRDYYALGRLIDEFARQQMLKKSSISKEPGYVLTGMALDMLFKYLVNGKNRRLGLQGLKGEGKEPSGERKQETRRYSSGDAFRDISIRHTLKTLAKQQKTLANIRSRDLRVYLKQPHRPQSDIVVCIDTSGSMGFHHELVYARLAAAGIVQAAIKNRDRVGLVAFNDYGQIAVPLTEKNGDSLIDCIAGLSIRGNTNIGDGLKCAAGILFRDRNDNQKYIVLVTDGQPTALSEKVFSQLQTLKGKDLTEESALIEARQAAARGAVISVIHIAGQGQEGSAFIRNIARIGKGNVRRLGKAEDLRVVLH